MQFGADNFLLKGETFDAESGLTHIEGGGFMDAVAMATIDE